MLQTIRSSRLRRLHWSTHEFSTQKRVGRFLFPSLLKEAACTPNVTNGKAIHAAIVEMGLHSDPYVASSLINMYVKCGSIRDAGQVFDMLPERDTVIWNTMINGYFQHGLWSQGFSSFREMQVSGFRPDQHSISILLSACGDCLDLEHGEEVHAYVMKNVFDPDAFLGTTLIDLYAKCGKEHMAYRVFEKASQKNACMWNAMIGGFYQNGCWERSLELFATMKVQGWQVEPAALSSVLTACSNGEELVFGEAVHCDAMKRGYESDPYVCTSLLALYARCRSIDDGRSLFNTVPNKGVGLWNSMIAAYVGSGRAEEALHAYTEMRCSYMGPDSFTVSAVLSACTLIGSYELGRTIHGELIKRPESNNMTVQSALVTMYSKCRNIEGASAVFSLIEVKDAIAWSSMIAGLCQNMKFKEAFILFEEMQAHGLKQDSTIIAVLISACVRLGSMELGCQIHGSATKTGTTSDLYVGSSLLDMYAKSGDMDSAENIFSGMLNKNLVVFNSMICGFSRDGQLDRSISTFAQILQHGLSPDSVSIVNVLVAVSAIATLEKGKMVHGYQIRNGITADVQASNALLDVYIKCGCLNYALHIFRNMPSRNVETFNSMIGGFGSHGCCHEAISLFKEMQGLGVRPDNITFLALISSCSHSGFVQEGLHIFHSMSSTFGIMPIMEHYASIVDLLGRAGHLNEIYKFIQSMPLEPDASIWQCFLHACRICKNVELGELAADHLRKMDTQRSGNDIQLLNLYGETGFLVKAANVRVHMRARGLKKNPGCSWIEVKNIVEVFYSGDSTSPRTREIYDALTSLRKNLKVAFSQWCPVIEDY